MKKKLLKKSYLIALLFTIIISIMVQAKMCTKKAIGFPIDNNAFDISITNNNAIWTITNQYNSLRLFSKSIDGGDIGILSSFGQLASFKSFGITSREASEILMFGLDNNIYSNAEPSANKEALNENLTIREKKIAFPVISLVTDSNNPSLQVMGWVNNGGNYDYTLITDDGVIYYRNNIFLAGLPTASGNNSNYWIKFREDFLWTNNWGSSNFPSGIGVQNGNNINVTTPGYYDVTFNLQTGAYVFTLSSIVDSHIISFVGGSIGPLTWATDIDLPVFDGVNYYLSAYNLPAGELKFRLDHEWAVNWGGDTFPIGIGVFSGATIVATPSGIYDVSFNRLSHAYSFTPTLSLAEQNRLKLELFPNPTQSTLNLQNPNNINFDKIMVTDLTGKIILEQTQNNNQVNVENLEQGMYLIQAFSGDEKFTSKFVKK